MCAIRLTVPVGVLSPHLVGGGTFVVPLSLRWLVAVAGLTILLLFDAGGAGVLDFGGGPDGVLDLGGAALTAEAANSSRYLSP
jgi:hypothetical protein